VSAILRNAPAQMVQARVPGLQVSFVFAGGEPTTLCLGVASNERREVVTPEHRFRVGSLSKPVAAIVHLIQIDRDVIGLDESVGREVAELCPQLSRELVDRLTPRLMLAHAGGFAVVHPPRDRLRRKSADWIGDPTLLRFDAAPGAGSTYTSAGYAVLEAIIERRTGRPFAQLARETLLDPLALRMMGFESDSGDDLGRAELTCDDHDEHGSVSRALPTATVSSSGMMGSTRDLCVLLREALFTSRVLSDASRSEMLTPQPPGLRGSHFTLGLHLYKGKDARSLGHGGHRAGHRSILVVIAAAQAVLCVATNSENGDAVIRRLTGLFRAITIGE